MNNSSKTYLDYAATTPLDEAVIAAMKPHFEGIFGNPSSTHDFGQKADASVEQARDQIATILNCNPHEIIFTACGTESDNLALRGVALAMRQQHNANHILISPVEHHAISQTAEQLAAVFGFELEYLPIDAYGRVTPKSVASLIRPDTAIVSVIYANNEIGSINPLAEIGEVCRSLNVPFHTDAVQGAAYLDIDVDNLNVDLMSIGAHKFHGPKGAGALYVREGTPLLPTQTGGGQENGYRAGTSNVPYIVGMATAFDLAQSNRLTHLPHYSSLRDRLFGFILEAIDEVQITGHPTDRLPNHASFVFEGVDGNNLLMQLDMLGFAVSSGSACKTGNPEPSEVLIALGLETEWALGSLRVTVGKQTTPQDVENFLAVLPQAVAQNRKLNGAG